MFSSVIYKIFQELSIALFCDVAILTSL